MNKSFRHETSAISRSKIVIQNASQGKVVIHHGVLAEDFSGLRLDSGLGNFAHYSSIIQKLEVFEKVASKEGGLVSLALLDDEVVVGYLACWYPDRPERWSALGKLLYELGAIEVSRNFRKMRIAHTMVDTMFSHGSFDEKIAYMNGFSWHWDLDGNRLSKFDYRKMMLKFLSHWGFREYYTNEPNIALRQENIFMARIGSNVSEEDRKRFRNLCFGIKDHS